MKMITNNIETTFRFLVNDNSLKDFGIRFNHHESFSNFTNSYYALKNYNPDFIISHLKSNLFSLGSLSESLYSNIIQYNKKNNIDILSGNNSDNQLQNHLHRTFPQILSRLYFMLANNQYYLFNDARIRKLFISIFNVFSDNLYKINESFIINTSDCLFNIIALSEFLNSAYMVGLDKSRYNRFRLINLLEFYGLRNKEMIIDL